MPVIVQLASGRRGTFRRVVPGTDEMLVFIPREPVAVDEKLINVIRKDLGHALVVCTQDANGIYRPDLEETEAVKSGKVSKPKRTTKAKPKQEKLVPQDTAEKMTPDEPQ